MEAVNKVASWASRVTNSDPVISSAMAAAFAVLVARSVSQERDIKSLEAEKASLTHSTKLLKHSIWSSKQSLLADPGATALVPLARLKAIYGDVLKEDDKSPATKLVV